MPTEEPIKEEWVVRFLNLPADEQVNFLFRYVLEQELRKEVENKVLNSDN